jgi:hypothetical protein
MSAATLPRDLSSQPSAGRTPASVRAGRILTGLVVLFLLFDCSIKIAAAKAAVEGTVKVGYPEHTVFPVGLTLLVCVILYVIPSTAVLGAILMTGYLGGATATMVRIENAWYFFPVALGVLAWLGLYLRDEQLRALVPLRE